MSVQFFNAKIYGFRWKLHWSLCQNDQMYRFVTTPICDSSVHQKGDHMTWSCQALHSLKTSVVVLSIKWKLFSMLLYGIIVNLECMHYLLPSNWEKLIAPCILLGKVTVQCHGRTITWFVASSMMGDLQKFVWTQQKEFAWIKIF